MNQNINKPYNHKACRLKISRKSCDLWINFSNRVIILNDFIFEKAL